MRLRVFDWNTPWFWLTVFYFPEHYGKPWLEVSMWTPHRWRKWWMNAWKWEQIPDENCGFEAAPEVERGTPAPTEEPPPVPRPRP